MKPKTIVLNPYKQGSRSARALAGELRKLGIPVSRFQRAPKSHSALIANWGNSQFDYDVREFPNILNYPGWTKKLSNKLIFFSMIGKDDPNVIKWTLCEKEAQKWGTKCLARMKVEASGGKGIIVFDPKTQNSAQFPGGAPLYTLYQPKTHEYRVHVSRGLKDESFSTMLVQRKVFVKTPERPAPTNWDIRNHDNGFIFDRQRAEDPHVAYVSQIAENFMKRHFPKVHFCALDILYHEKKNHAWVIEGNTAPGLENQTVATYALYLKERFEELQK